MKSNQSSPVWPYLVILACLFAISVAAPRGWESLARRESIANFLQGERDAYQQRMAKAARAPEPVIAQLPPREKQPTEATIDEGPNFISSATESWAKSHSLFRTASLAPPEQSDVNTQSAVPEPVVDPRPDDVAAAEPPAQYCFPLPVRLIADLKLLSAEPPTADWASTALRLLEEHCQEPSGTETGKDRLEQLRRHAEEADTFAKNLQDPLEASLLRAQYALERRILLWECVHRVNACAPGAGKALNETNDSRMRQIISQVETQTGGQQYAAGWRDLFRMSQLKTLANDNQPGISDQRRALARQVLVRLAGLKLTPAQQQFVESRPVAELRDGLKVWATQPLDCQRLLTAVERYEESELPSDARFLAEECRALHWSSDPAEQSLADQLDEHYRNANVRLAVSALFLNRFVPQPGPRVAAVNDRILGAEVTGRSATFTQLKVLLIPDRTRLRIGLEAEGVVNSNTAASSGPATFYNNGQAQFIVRKLFLCSPTGLKVRPAQAEAETMRSDLVGFETSYDGVPLVGAWVRDMAMQQRDESQHQARVEADQHVAVRARNSFDQDVEPRIRQALALGQAKFLTPLENLGLEPQALSMSTSADRAVVRARLASDRQLAAHTPRPRAPSDSLLSLQIQESAVNNALERLELDGRTFELPELFEHVARKLNRPAQPLPEDLPENVRITFAEEGAVRVHCDDGRVELRIKLAELVQGRRRWRNFGVHTFYRPDAGSLETRFVRDSAVFLDGDQFKGKVEVTLRSIFSKVLAPTRNWGLLPPELAKDPRLSDVEITQFSVDKGWIGVAYAPRRQPLPVARRPR